MRPYLKTILVLKHYKRVCVFFEELKETQRNKGILTNKGNKKGISTKGNNIALEITKPLFARFFCYAFHFSKSQCCC